MYIGRVLEEKPLDMREFDPLNGYKTCVKLRGTFKDERRSQVFENYLEHARAEATADFDALIASCSSKRQTYAFFNSTGKGTVAGSAPQSVEEMKTYYRNLIAANIYLLHREVEKLIVGDDTLLVDGIIHQLYPGRLLVDAMKYRDADPKSVYQMTLRIPVAFVFDEDGKGAGEHSYSRPPRWEDFTVVPPELVPERFWNNPITGRVEL